MFRIVIAERAPDLATSQRLQHAPLELGTKLDERIAPQRLVVQEPPDAPKS